MHRLSGEPVTTLDHEIPNVIVEVRPSMIRRRSATPHGTDGQSSIPASAVENLWRQLLDRDETYQAGSPAFAYAFMAPWSRRRLCDQSIASYLWRSNCRHDALVRSGINARALKWSPAREPATIERHLKIAKQRGAFGGAISARVLRRRSVSRCFSLSWTVARRCSHICRPGPTRRSRR